VTLRNTTSLCRKLWFEYKVVIEVLVFERLLILIVFGVDCVVHGKRMMRLVTYA
jgi:hypothetical protein